MPDPRVVDDAQQPRSPMAWAQVVGFYSRQARANNHEFREAACECFSELAQKIDRGAVQPRVPAMLAAVLGCFRDSSWPVR